jgi:cysteine-rich repeat protein
MSRERPAPHARSATEPQPWAGAMDAFSRRIGLAVLAIVAACSLSNNVYTPPENCTALGDEDRNGLADCDDPVCAGLPTCRSAAPPMCGNGSIERDEECDDGNDSNGDACENDCTAPRCGNGIHDRGEACDDGNANNDDDCHNNCSAPSCGNGIVDANEQCDGAAVGGRACEPDCTLARCGNTIMDAGEQCDDGNLINGDTCEADCTNPFCGNHIIDEHEGMRRRPGRRPCLRDRLHVGALR